MGARKKRVACYAGYNQHHVKYVKINQSRQLALDGVVDTDMTWVQVLHIIYCFLLFSFFSYLLLQVIRLLSCILSEDRLLVVPHFSSGIVERAKRERAWKSPHVRKGDTFTVHIGHFHARSRFARSTIPEEKLGTTRSLEWRWQSDFGVSILVTT